MHARLSDETGAMRMAERMGLSYAALSDSDQHDLRAMYFASKFQGMPLMAADRLFPNAKREPSQEDT